MDLFSGFPEAFPTPDKSAQTMAHLIIDEIFPRYSAPLEILSDNGSENINHVIKETLKELNVHHVTCSYYHPQSNGVVKRYHKTVTNEKLPLTKHLFGISWVVVSHTRLNFAVVCNARLQQLQTHPTRDLIKVNPGCTATNKYFTISTPFVVGRSTTVYNNTLDLTTANFSHIKDLIWKPLRDKFPNETKLQIPKTLAEINDMSLTNLISQIDSVDDIDLTTKPSFSPWFYVSLVLVLVVLIIIVLCCVYKNWKYKCLPNCLRDAQKKQQRPTVSTEIELQEMKLGGTLPPAEVSANETSPSRERLYPHLYWKNSAN